MIDVNTALQNILKAVYGKEVRQSIHDAISQINDNSLEAIDLSQIKYGTDVVATTSPIGSYVEGTLYLNTDTGILWKLLGGVWSEVMHLKAIDEIKIDSSSGLNDTYKIIYNDGTSTTYTITNGSSISDIKKIKTVGLVDTYEISLDNGQKVPTKFTVTNGEDAFIPVAKVTKTNDVATISITDDKGTTTVDVNDGKSVVDVTLDATVGNAKTYKMKSSDGTFLPTKFTINDGISSYIHIRYSASFDGNPMTSTPSASTPYIGICTSTQSSAPTDPSVYSWVKFIGESGSGTGDMKKSEYATKYAGAVDKAVALFDGANELDASQLMRKSIYDADGDGVVDISAKVGTADTTILEKFAENDGQLTYNGSPIETSLDTITEAQFDAETNDGVYFIDDDYENPPIADNHKFGFVTLSNSAGVTVESSSGMALPTSEKNATIEGTLANQISKLNENFVYKKQALSVQNGMGACTYYKLGRIVNVYLEWNPTEAIAHGLTVVSGLPTEVSGDYFIGISHAYGCYSAMLKNGELALYFPTDTAPAGQKRADVTFSYISAN